MMGCNVFKKTVSIIFATNLVAACALFIRSTTSIFCLLVVGSIVTLLAACSTPQAPVAKAVYDFGPAVQLATASVPLPTQAALTLGDVDASPALDHPAVHYRLAYADALQLRPYTLARWSASPTRLVQQRLREALSVDRAMLSTAEAATPWLLRVELEEFSQWFDAPGSSAGVVRLRATLLRSGQLVAQRSFNARSPAPSADAAGGVRALVAASDDANKQIYVWLTAQTKAP